MILNFFQKKKRSKKWQPITLSCISEITRKIISFHLYTQLFKIIFSYLIRKIKDCQRYTYQNKYLLSKLDRSNLIA